MASLQEFVHCFCDKKWKKINISTVTMNKFEISNTFYTRGIHDSLVMWLRAINQRKAQ